jgi:D-glycero-D-manno-heptose 1,7-bisphosphate phosphatase
MSTLHRAVFLDRDGVIIRAVIQDGRPYAARSMKEMEILPGVAEAMSALRQADFRIVVVTNQPDVATGLVQREVVETMHEALCRQLPIDDIKVCYHIDADGCFCRKPKPGMLVEAAQQWSLDMQRSFMVGDRWRDIAAGTAAGCKTILVESGYNERAAESPDFVVDSLLEASRLILAQNL